MMSELVRPDVNKTDSTKEYMHKRFAQFEKHGWAKDGNGVTYSVSAMRPEIDDWIKQQNPDMYELLGNRYYWFKNPELEILFLLRWS